MFAHRTDMAAQPPQPPAAPDLEESLLGAMLLDPDAVARVVGLVCMDTFSTDAHRVVFEAIIHLFDRGQPINLITVVDQLRVANKLVRAGNAYGVSRLTNRVAGSTNVEYVARILAQYHLRRELLRVNTISTAEAYNECNDPFETVDKAVAALNGLVVNYTRAGLLSHAEHEVEEIALANAPPVHVKPTGWPSLDKAIGGWRNGNLIILAGRPGMGKTSTLVSLANAAASAGVPVLLFQMELTRAENQSRLVACRTGIPHAAMVNGRMTPEELARREQAMREAGDLPLYIHYGQGLKLHDIQAEIARAKRVHGVQLVLIDQLNWIDRPQRHNRDQEMGDISRGLKLMARQQDVPIVVAHQLSRDVERRGGDKRPVLSDLRDSGNIEQDAQVVLFTYRPEYYRIMEDEAGNSTAGALYLLVSKNSNGPPDEVRLQFDGPTLSVREWDLAGDKDYADYHGDNPF